MPSERLVALYRDRSEWKDVQPIYNSEVEEGVIKISTSEECKTFIIKKIFYLI